ncbi:MAG: hypothetical protein ACREYB_09570 [Casimicrobiaceae bacterium]
MPGDVAMALRVLRRLPGFLRNPLTLAESLAIVRRRRERRAGHLLHLARAVIFADPANPYHALLRAAGCEYGDLERLVRQDGVEGSLRTLLRHGVYLTVDEFKGRRPAVRGSTSVTVDPEALGNPLPVAHLWARTSGSRGAARRMRFDLECVRDRAVNMFLAQHARGGAQWRTAIWGAPGLIPVLWYSAWGVPTARWFCKVDLRELEPRFRWTARVFALASGLAAMRMARLEYAPVSAPTGIAAWMRQVLAAGETPHLCGAPSSVVRLCETAEASGVDLAGARFTITGEPVTAARLAVIHRVGGEAMPDYGSADSGGTVGYGCLAPAAADDVHVFDDVNAVVQADGPPFPAGALLVSSLLPSSPLILLNVSMGDRATMVARRCGCPMEAIGWGTHLHTVRSFEKLTAGGVTFGDVDIVRVLEEVLPRRFGGGPADYQLIEDETGEGAPRLRLLVHPAIGAVDAGEVLRVFVAAISAGAGATRHMAAQWQDAGFLRVERAPPRISGGGKILHLVAAPAAPLPVSR